MSARIDQRTAAPSWRGSGPGALAPVGGTPIVRTGAMSKPQPTKRELHYQYRGLEEGIRRGVRRGFALGALSGAIVGFFAALLVVALHRAVS